MKDYRMIETLINSAFAGVNSRLDLIDARLKKVEESVADQKELNQLMDKRIDETIQGISKAIKETKGTIEEGFYPEYKNGEVE